MKLVAPSLLLKDWGLLCPFSQPSPTKTSAPLNSLKKLIHFLQFSHQKQLPLPHGSCSSLFASIKYFYTLLKAC